jgi:hypothetical protein
MTFRVGDRVFCFGDLDAEDHDHSCNATVTHVNFSARPNCIAVLRDDRRPGGGPHGTWLVNPRLCTLIPHVGRVMRRYGPFKPIPKRLPA